MNIKPIAADVRNRVSSLYGEKFPVKGQPPVVVPNFDERITRWKRFLTATNGYDERLKKTRERQERRAKMMKRARAILANPDAYRFVAIDTIPNIEETTIGEFGITVYENGVKTSRHFVTDDNTREPTEFRYGETEVMSVAKALDIFHREIETADFLVGHTIVSDFINIRELTKYDKLPPRSLLDTMKLHPMALGSYKESCSLEYLCHLYGVTSYGPTNAGNQARNALDASFKIMSRMIA